MKLGWGWAGAAGATLQTPKEEEGGGRGGSEDSKVCVVKPGFHVLLPSCCKAEMLDPAVAALAVI